MGKHSTTYWDRATAADAATRAKQLLDTVYILKTSAIESWRLKNKVAGNSYSRKMEEAYIRDHRQVAAASPLPPPSLCLCFENHPGWSIEGAGEEALHVYIQKYVAAEVFRKAAVDEERG